MCSTDWGRKEGRQSERGREGGERERERERERDDELEGLVWLWRPPPSLPLARTLFATARAIVSLRRDRPFAVAVRALSVDGFALVLLSPSSSCAGFRGERSGGAVR